MDKLCAPLSLRQSGVWHSTSSSLNWETESDNNYRAGGVAANGKVSILYIQTDSYQWSSICLILFPATGLLKKNWHILMEKNLTRENGKYWDWKWTWSIFFFSILWILPLINQSIIIEQYCEKTLRANCSPSQSVAAVLQLCFSRNSNSWAMFC